MGEFRMPSLGADMAVGTLRKWNVKPGDIVNRGDIIAEVETQKGIIDIEVFESGVIGALVIQENEKVPVGTLLTTILPATREPQIIPKAAASGLKASPLARKIAAEMAIDLTKVNGTGPGGAITKHDVESQLIYKDLTEKKYPEITGADMRQAIATAMSLSQQEIPPYVVRTIIDMKPCLDHLSKINSEKPPKERILTIALFAKAIAMALKKFPLLNGWWKEKFEESGQINLGIVVSLRSGGLVVPVIQKADELTTAQMMQQLSELILRSRSGHLKSSDMVMAGLTITSLGETGVESMTGIIYPPQVALVSIGGIKEIPWAINGMLTVRPSVEISLSADHRATDGIYGSNFLDEIRVLLEKPEQL